MTRFNSYSRIFAAASLASLLVLGGCGGAGDEVEAGEELQPYAGKSSTSWCAKLSPDVCQKRSNCVLEESCSGVSTVCADVDSAGPGCIDVNGAPPVCTATCVHWTQAACGFIDSKKTCNSRPDCQFECVQMAIGCPPDVPDCGEHCFCMDSNVNVVPPIGPGDPRTSKPPVGPGSAGQ